MVLAPLPSGAMSRPPRGRCSSRLTRGRGRSQRSGALRNSSRASCARSRPASPPTAARRARSARPPASATRVLVLCRRRARAVGRRHLRVASHCTPSSSGLDGRVSERQVGGAVAAERHARASRPSARATSSTAQRGAIGFFATAPGTSALPLRLRTRSSADREAPAAATSWLASAAIGLRQPHAAPTLPRPAVFERRESSAAWDGSPRRSGAAACALRSKTSLSPGPEEGRPRRRGLSASARGRSGAPGNNLLALERARRAAAGPPDARRAARAAAARAAPAAARGRKAPRSLARAVRDADSRAPSPRRRDQLAGVGERRWPMAARRAPA